VARVFDKLGLFLAKHGVEPNYLTLSSLLFSTLAFLSMYMLLSIPLYVMFILLSGLMDLLDGMVARLSNKVSKLGSFLDSTLDRVSDVLIIYPLSILGFDKDYVILLIAISLLISYVRAKGESLNMVIEGVGLIERAERMIFIVLISILYMISITASLIAFYILIALSIITLLERIVRVTISLKNVG